MAKCFRRWRGATVTRQPGACGLICSTPVAPSRATSRTCSLMRDQEADEPATEVALAPSGLKVRSGSRPRQNASGQELVEIYADEIEAGLALEAVARVKRKRGYRDL